MGKENTMRTVIVLATILLALPAALHAEAPERRTATFAVQCYDVGRAALTGLPGVVAVESGWRGGQEVNVVRYDPAQVSPTRLEDELRRAGTWVDTLPATP
jgi:hypothetical protein